MAYQEMVFRSLSGLPRHRENREFGCAFFQTGKTQGICQKYLKYEFTQGIYLQHRENVEVLKINVGFVMGCSYNLSTHGTVFELGTT